MSKFLIVISILMFSLVGCGDGQSVSGEGKSTNSQTRELIQQMEWVENANVEVLVKQKLKAPRRFLAVEADGEILIPGLPKDVCELVVNNGDYEILPGMSEIVYNSRHAELRVKTRDFATTYNKKLIDLIKLNT
ncbi:hypothetical protein [Kangiella koreensis]|uniref:Lipoprotein n=1 Tax=Kangiella koreensis (strain DSM 16069 / JCM 12317 / KCTC 12182 / SW-125) TaxID=523791 RepID=C7RB24_KANKD|nr:hypothetical protein [Kangiella koreensis]ACV26466.1 hypothetical protein Kkor_1047 [Kangiella koreensis DSM 16069]